jgi:endonuclease YncB( thermonuclease family)
MSISFAQWRKAEGLKFHADLQALKRRGEVQWRRVLKRSRASLALLGLAACLGAAIGVAFDGLEHRRSEPARKQAKVRTTLVVATVIDGDTLKLGSERIRLHGIDAPESLQRCADGWQAGDVARRALADLLLAGSPSCEKVTTDRYGRTVAICHVNGEDIGREMVRRGLAWAYVRYSLRYVPEESLARFERLGVHARACQPPAEWRAQHRQ